MVAPGKMRLRGQMRRPLPAPPPQDCQVCCYTLASQSWEQPQGSARACVVGEVVIGALLQEEVCDWYGMELESDWNCRRFSFIEIEIEAIRVFAINSVWN